MTQTHSTRLVQLLMILTGVLSIVGCAAVGPQTISRDRFDYHGEVSRSWKEQTLLNIVKSRYSDLPVFLDVSQIVSGYTLESTVSMGVTVGRTGEMLPPGDNLTLGAQGKWTDRPTITYTPLTGAQFNRSLLTPIPPSAVLFTMQAGWPINLVFRVVVRSINGIDSDTDTARYERIVALLRTLQQTQAMGMRVQSETAERQAVVLFFRSHAFTPEQEAIAKELREILGLAPDRREFRVTFGAVPANDGEIAMLTRSMLQMLIDIGSYVDVPDVDLREGRTVPSHAPAGTSIGRLLRIKFSPDQPQDALAAVRHRGGWFWLDDRDIESKRTFALVMIFSTLAETGARESLPLVTIPAG